MSSRQSSRNASTPYLAKAFQATAIVVVSYFLYWTYQLYQYGEIPISKKDVMLRQAILARFPADYEVEIKGADLLGFGEKFLVAYGNRRFVGKAFAMDDQVIERLERNQGRTNLPLVKVFYIAEPGLLSSLLNLSPFLDIQKNMVELSLREYRKIQLVPFDPDAKRNRASSSKPIMPSPAVQPQPTGSRRLRRRRPRRTAPGLPVLRRRFGRDALVGDLRPEGRRADRPFRLSGNARHRRRPVHPGGQPVRRPRRHPAARPASAGRRGRPSSERFALTAAERQALVADPPQRDDYARVLMSLSPRSPYAPDRFIDLGDGSRLSLAPRHTDDYSTFLDIGGKKIFVEAFYVDDDACHWCEHRWRVMAFHYDDGRWISDRTINGDSFNGQWLRNAEPLGLNDVFGTYRDQARRAWPGPSSTRAGPPPASMTWTIRWAWGCAPCRRWSNG